MPEFELQYLPGVVADDTVLTRKGRYIDADKIRFVRADPGQEWRPQLIDGWERLTLTAITGLCRTVFPWTDNTERLNIAFATHSKLLVWRDGVVYDITPYGPPARLATDPLATTNLSGTVVVTQAAHGYANGISVKVYGAPTMNGIAAANLNGIHVITVIGAGSYSFVAGAADVASSTATGGGSNVIVVPQTVLPAGQQSGTGGSGYGAPAWGIGAYGEPATTDTFPRTWSFGLLGEALVACPRGGAIYLWENDSATRAQPITTAPLEVTSLFTTPERVIVALGCEEEASPHTFNTRCARHSDPTDETVWNTDTNTLAREKILEGAGRLIAGRNAGPANFAWTDNEVFEVAYVGALDEVYSFTPRGAHCGLIGPNGAVVDGSTAYWMSPEVDFYTLTLGGTPQTMPSPVRAELQENLAASQRDKVVATTIAGRHEVWFHYPDSRDGSENSRAVFFHPLDGWWSKALIERTAFCDGGASDYPIGVDPDGNAYWHERGRTNDGNAISWSLEAGPQYIDAGHSAIFLRSFWPDFKDQVGAIGLTIYTREYPQSTPEAFGPYSMNPAPDTEKVDLHIDGRIISWKITGNSGPASFRLGTPIVEGKATRRAR